MMYRGKSKRETLVGKGEGVQYKRRNKQFPGCLKMP